MSVPLLVAENVEVRYHGTSQPAVVDANLEVSRGAAIGLVGESGSGKTTFARTLVGALTPSNGEVRVEGRLWAELERGNPLRRKVQMIFQDPYASLNPLLTARETVAEVLQVWNRMSRPKAHQAALELLAEVGLGATAAASRPRRLSGGQRQRVGIARALACDPEALVADEPTSSLDVSVQAQILNLLADLRDKRGLALVLISHDLGVVRHMTERALVMYAGHVIEAGPTAELFSDPRHPYTRVLLDSIPDQPGDARFVVNDVASSGGCVFARRCSHLGERCTHRHPEDTETNGRTVACFYPLAKTAAIGDANSSANATLSRRTR